jgi:threonine dehydrogenase-like Zn-dependent dehydrogenase
MNKALWHIDHETSVLKEVNSPVEKDGLLEIESRYSLISTGTERLVSLGKVLPSFDNSMAVPYMEGGFALPIKYGYSLVGEVISEGKYKGKNVHLMHPHQSRCWVEEENVTLLPDGMALEKAPLISNIETVINAIWDSEVTIGQTVLIAGFGNIGALLAETIRHIPGVRVYILEQNEWRKAKAKELGYEISPINDVDIAFDTTASSGGLQACIQSVKDEGTVINLSWYGSKSVQINLGADFHYGRKKIISSQVSVIPNNKKSNWDYAKRKALAIQLLMQYPYEKCISTCVPFEESVDFYHQLREGTQGDGLIWCIGY